MSDHSVTPNRTTFPTLAAAVREALACLGTNAPIREVRQYIRATHPSVEFTDKSLGSTIGVQRKGRQTRGEATVRQLTDLSRRLTDLGMSADAMLVRVREARDLALSVGGYVQLMDCLGLLIDLRGSVSPAKVGE